MGVLEQTIPYVYAASGWKDRLVSYGNETITYDALGNPITYRGHTLVWGKIKQLQSFDGNSFAYNAEGIRTSKNNITYELDGTKILREVRGANVIEYFYGSNGVAGFSYNGTQYYYQKNLQGDITAIYSAFGIKVAEYVYDAWGKCTVVLDTDGIGTLNPFRYRGYYYDTETGLYYLQTRYYDPEVGRFINADNLVATGQGILGHNMFAYCRNNPVSRKDAFGSTDQDIMDDDSNLLDDDKVHAGGKMSNGGQGGSGAGRGGSNGGKGYTSPGQANSNSVSKMKDVRAKGAAGEARAGITKNTKRIDSLTGTANYRVPDGLDWIKKILHEVKNYSGKLSYTGQFKDYVLWSRDNGFVIYLHTNAELSAPLQHFVDINVIVKVALK